MCYHPSGYIIFNLRELKFYEGSVSDMRAGGRITETPTFKSSGKTLFSMERLNKIFKGSYKLLKHFLITLY